MFMAKIRIVTAIAGAALLFAASASAQTPGSPDRIVLESKTGSVMASTGGEYQSANPGRQLAVGESLMLGERANATVVYYYTNANGDVVRKCTERYSGANTYVIDDSCVPAAAWTGARSPGAGWIVGAALVGAAILNSMDDAPVGPLSTGPNGNIRHF
jgi:hypothetical protein